MDRMVRENIARLQQAQTIGIIHSDMARRQHEATATQAEVARLLDHIAEARIKTPDLFRCSPDSQLGEPRRTARIGRLPWQRPGHAQRTAIDLKARPRRQRSG